MNACTRSGETIHGLINLSAIADKSGNARYFILQIQDISSLICTKTELEESRQRFRALSDATFEAVFISVKGICIDANRTASIMFDTPREKLIGIFGTDVIAPEYQSRVRENMLAGYEAPYHAVALKKSGIRFHVMIQGKMIHIGGREVRVTVVRDIDAQVTAETALRESERHLRSLMESASNFVLFRLLHYPDNPCQPQQIFISPSIAEIVDRDQVFDFSSWLKVIHPEDRETLLDAGRKMLETSRMDETVRIRDRSGSGWRWLHIISVAVSDETDNQLFFNGIILDITKEMEAAAALKTREKELKERTESLSEVNTALEVLLRKREADRMDVEEKMLTNAKSLILPYLEKLKASRLDDRQRVYLNLVESSLNEIISPLTRRMSRHFLNFTPHGNPGGQPGQNGKNDQGHRPDTGSLHPNHRGGPVYHSKKNWESRKNDPISGPTCCPSTVTTPCPAVAAGRADRTSFFRHPAGRPALGDWTTHPDNAQVASSRVL